MKQKSAEKFAQRLAEFLSNAPEAELIGEDENLAKILIPRSTDLQAGEAFAGYVQAERHQVKENAPDYDFVVTDEGTGDEVILRYQSMTKVKNEVYFIFEMREPVESDTDVKGDEESAEVKDEEIILEQD